MVLRPELRLRNPSPERKRVGRLSWIRLQLLKEGLVRKASFVHHSEYGLETGFR